MINNKESVLGFIFGVKLLIVFFVANSFVSEAFANSGGITGQSIAGCAGAGCHSGGTYNYSGTVQRWSGSSWLSSSTSIESGDSLSIRYFLDYLSGSAAPAGGFNMSANGGTLSDTSSTIDDNGTGNGQLTHTTPRLDVSNNITFSGITWDTSTAESGTYTIYACGQPVNLLAANNGDGPSRCDSLTVTVRPAVNSWSGTYTYNENTQNGAFVNIDTFVYIDGQTNMNRAEVAIVTPLTGDDLACPSPSVTGISCSDFGDSLTLSGTSSQSNYETAIERIRFRNTSQNPSTAIRSVRLRIRDSSNVYSSYVYKSVDVNPQNDIPTTSGWTGTTFYTETNGTNYVTIDSAISLSDVDDTNLNRAEITITNAQSGDQLDCNGTFGGIACSGEGTSSIVLTGTTTLTNYDSTIQSLRFRNTSNDPSTTTRTVTMRVRDASNGYSATASKSISVTSVNDLPTTSGWTGTTFYTETNGTNYVTIDSAITLSDVDDTNLNRAEITITNAQTGDQLDCNGTFGGIACSGEGTSSIVLTGTTTLANYDNTIQALRFRNTSNDPSTTTRTVTMRVRDASNAYSSLASKSISVTAVNDLPTTSGWTGTTNYTEGDGTNYQVIDSAISLSDVDDTNLNRAEITITNAQTGDQLDCNGTFGGIVCSGEGTSSIVLTGTTTLTNYDSTIQALRFRNTSNDPNTTTRTVTMRVRDASNGYSATASKSISITATNDAPIITEGTSTTVVMSEDSSPTPFSLTLNATDADSSTLTWSISSAASNGSATATGTGNSKAISYTPNANFNGSDSFDVRVSDGLLNDTITVNVTVNAENDPPVITEGVSTSVSMSEDGNPDAFSLTLNATDAESSTLTWSISSAASNGSATATGTGTSKAISYTPNTNFNGSDSFDVRVSDGLLSDTITVNVTVNAVNDAPVITEGVSTSVIMSEDSNPTPFSLTLNATDIESAGSALTWSISSAASNGTAGASGTGSSKAISYTPDLDYNGSDSFVVQVSDGALTDTITVNVTIGAGNDTPVITEGTSTTVNMSEDSSPTAFSLTLNATDTENDTLTWSISSAASDGTASTSGTGTSKAISYTPDANFTGSDSFVVQVTDGSTSDFITVNVNIAAINDAPIISEGTSTTVNISEDNNPTAFNLTLNASDVDTSDTLTWSISSAASNGTATATGTGTSKAISYTPNAHYNGSDSFVVQVSDGTLSDTITVNVNIAALNDAPIITEGTSATVIMSEDGSPAPFNLTLNATDVDSATLNWSISSAASNGTASASGTGTSKAITYLPDTNFNGSDSFTVQVSDGLLSDTFTVNVTVNAVNDAPVITEGTNTTVNMSEDSTPTPFSLTLNATDVESLGGALSWSISTAASNGTAGATGSGASKAITYTPNLDFVGTDSFIVEVSDGALTDTITVNVNVGATNDTPVITEGASTIVIMSEDSSPTPFSLSLNATDNDNAGSELTWSISTAATNGSASASGSGNSKIISYTPTANYNGSDSFIVEVSDGSTSDFITVNVTINAVNDAPIITEGTSTTVVMSEDSSPTPFNLTLNATDLDNTAGELTWSISGAANNGTASTSGTGLTKAINYTPSANFNGTDSFVVQVSDGSLSDTITVNVTVNAVGDAPIITEGTSTTVVMSEDSNPTPFNLILNATDTDSATLTWSIGSTASNGNASTSGTGNSKVISYTPNANFNGSDSFVVQVTDGILSDTITVNVTVNAENDAPLITEGTSTTVNMSVNSSPTPFALTLNATDVDSSDTLTWSISSPASFGTASTSGTGSSKSISYTPDVDYEGSDSFIVTVSDGALNDTITVNVNIQPPNVAPTIIATNAPANGIEDTLITFSVSVTDPDDANDGSGALTWNLINAPAGMTISNTGIISWTPVIGTTSSGTVTVSVADGGENGASAANADFVIAIGTNVNDQDQDGLFDSALKFTINQDDNLGFTASTLSGMIVYKDAAPGTVTVSAEFIDSNVFATNFDWSASSSEIYNIAANFSINSHQFEFDPSGIDAGLYLLDVIASDGSASIRNTLTITIAENIILAFFDCNGDGINSGANELDAGDCDNDGTANIDEIGDTDYDGVPDYLDDSGLAENEIDDQGGDKSSANTLVTETGLTLRLGDIAQLANRSGVVVSLEDIANFGSNAGGSVSTEDDDYSHISGIYSFEIAGVTPGGSTQLVIPLTTLLPPDAVYRKFINEAWTDYVIDSNNNVQSAPFVDGIWGDCPEPGSTSYTDGLSAFDGCIQLTIEDGGANDADGEINGVIKDPSGPAIPNNPTNSDTLSAVEGGGQLSLIEILALVLLLSSLCYYRTKYK